MDSYATYIPPKVINQPSPAAATKQTEVRAVAEQFEAMFLAEMMKPMFEATKSEDPMFGGSHGEEMFQSILVDEYAAKIGETGGIGIADQIERQLLSIQEVE